MQTLEGYFEIDTFLAHYQFGDEFVIDQCKNKQIKFGFLPTASEDNKEKINLFYSELQKYEIGGHFNKMHCERASLQSMHRVFAWMTYLNDVEDGGETYFEHYNLSVKPSKGKTLIWPAEWTHAHRVEI